MEVLIICLSYLFKMIPHFFHTLGLDPWHLAAVEQLTYCGKSLLVALAASKRRVGVQEALRLARLEEAFQSEEWGEVEAVSQAGGGFLRQRAV